MQPSHRERSKTCSGLSTRVSSSKMNKMTSLLVILASCWVLGGATVTTKSQMYINSGTDKTFTDNVIFQSPARSQLECAVLCNHHDSCMTFTFHEDACTGHGGYMSSCSASVPATEARSFARQKEAGATCERTGVKRLIDTSLGVDRDVYCDGDWLVFQRRIDGCVDFYLGWDDYVTGFGDVYGEYWLGLENLHRITTSGVNFELRVTVTAFNGISASAYYSNFYVGPATDHYRMNYSSFQGGDAGDSLNYQRGMKFTTWDADHDLFNVNCAVTYHGAWWYKYCHHSNLNGRYVPTETVDDTGVVWRHFSNNQYYTLKSCQMMIRPM